MEYWRSELRNKNRGYMKLTVWQNALALFQLVWKMAYVEAKIDFKLRAQLLDAAQSVSANIAEGYGRRSAKEYIQFLYCALGSLAETLTRSIGLHSAGQIADPRFHELNLLHYETENRLLRLIDKIEQKRGDDEWIARIGEDESDYSADAPDDSITPPLHYSNTPAASDA